MDNIITKTVSDIFNFVFYSFNNFIDFIFNQAYIADDVSIGWFIVICAIFKLLFDSIVFSPVGIFKDQKRNEGSEKFG